MTWMDVGPATATRGEHCTTSESQLSSSPAIIHLSKFRFVCHHDTLVFSGGQHSGFSALTCRKWHILIAARGDRGVCISSVLSLLFVFSPIGPLASLSVCLEGNVLAVQYCCIAPAVLQGVGCGSASARWGSGGCSDRNLAFEDASIGKSMESPALNVQTGILGSQTTPPIRAVSPALGSWLFNSSTFLCPLFFFVPSTDPLKRLGFV